MLIQNYCCRYFDAVAGGSSLQGEITDLFVDASEMIEKVVPEPVWKKECAELEFKIITKIPDLSQLADLWDNLVDDIERAFESIADQISNLEFPSFFVDDSLDQLMMDNIIDSLGSMFDDFFYLLEKAAKQLAYRLEIFIQNGVE